MKKQRSLIRSALALTVAQLLLLAFFLCGCARVITDVSDELTMNEWGRTFENGNVITLRFEDDNACFAVKTSMSETELSGLCVLSPTDFVIMDKEMERNYRFSYVVHGDHIDLSYDGSTIALDKITPAELVTPSGEDPSARG